MIVTHYEDGPPWLLHIMDIDHPDKHRGDRPSLFAFVGCLRRSTVVETKAILKVVRT